MTEQLLYQWESDNMLEVAINDEDFLKIKETLTRIGISCNKNRRLVQTCHILQKRGKYYIVHFKEMFLLDGKASTLTIDDIQRRNVIATLLDDWNLLDILNTKFKVTDTAFLQQQLSNITVVKFSDKDSWEFESKYTISGGNRKQNLHKSE
jgi:hypothetical protein